MSARPWARASRSTPRSTARRARQVVDAALVVRCFPHTLHLPQTSGLSRGNGSAPQGWTRRTRRSAPTGRFRACLRRRPCPFRARGNQDGETREDRGRRRDPHQAGGSRRRGAHRVPRADGATSWPSCARRCARSDTEYKVFKNTLARRAVEGRGLDELADAVRGPGGHRVRARRRRRGGQGAAGVRPNNPALVLKGGLLGERVITPVDIEALADLPSREVLLAQIAGVFQAPLTKAAGPVPGVHPQLRLRREGADRPACRRRRSRARRPRLRPRMRPPSRSARRGRSTRSRRTGCRRAERRRPPRRSRKRRRRRRGRRQPASRNRPESESTRDPRVHEEKSEPWQP